MSRKLNYYGSYASDIIKTGLQLHYDSTNTLCYSGSGTDLFDLQGNYDGVLSGVGYNTTTKYLEYSLGDFTTIDRSFILNSGQPFTINFIINNQPSTPFPSPFTLRSSMSQPFVCFISNVGGYVGVNIGSQSQWVRIRNNIAFTNNINQLVTITYNGLGTTNIANFEIYINNVLQPKVANSPYAPAGNFSKLGGYQPINNNVRFVGDYPFFTVYNRVLTSAELLKNYNRLSSKFGV